MNYTGKAPADRILHRVANYCGLGEGLLLVIQEATSEIINFERFADGLNFTDAMLDGILVIWLTEEPL